MTIRQTKAKLPTLRFKSGEDVKVFRKKLGLNQSQFWSHVKVTQSGGSRFESGRNIPMPVQILLHLAYATDKQAETVFKALRTTPEAD
ncbi:MAG TPA: helix-turn-helix transcriptional regulator [Rhodocyclaceae bacterium]|nr:helix-turn-helix transcriptional regulator [Zoogloeaceae bacterium]HRD33769.1 helix-turn-helix transcriptional regulator [Rhodocyclaceae bacterium]